VLVNPAALALGIGSDRFHEITLHTLAHNWFGDEMYPAADAALGMGEGLPEYATVVIDEALSGPAARRRRIVEYLREYDEAQAGASEKPLGVTLLNDPPGQRRIANAKAALFFAALEDACGETPMRSGLRQMVTLLRGQEASYDSLRSALEQSSGKNLGELFHVWLNDKGIPAGFRDRYQTGGEN
jgi:aminopeptidase N